MADANGDGILQWEELVISNDIVIMATPEIANLGVFVVGLMSAGAMAAALSTADGLMIAILPRCHRIFTIDPLTHKQLKENDYWLAAGQSSLLQFLLGSWHLIRQVRLRKFSHGRLRWLPVLSFRR